PVTVEGLALDGNTAAVNVCQNDSPNCCSEGVVDLPNCVPNCGFNDIFAEAYACDNGEFLVDLAFHNPQGGPLGFYIFGDGMIFGPFSYGEEYYTFGPLDGTEAAHDILLIDIANPACFGNYDLSFTFGDECAILDVVATPSDCNEGEFYVTLDIAANNTGEQFSVVGNGTNYGTFAYTDLPITLGPLAGDAETVYEFGVIDLAHANCTNWTVIDPVDCLPCDIRDLVYEVECGVDYFQLTIDFIHENEDSDLFALLIDGELYEWFPYANLPLTVDLPLSLAGTSLRVEDVNNELCGMTVDLEVPCCSLNGPEAISASDCQDDGTFFLEIGGLSGYNLSDSVVVQYAPAGTTLFETVTLAYADLPTNVGPVAGNGTTTYFLLVNDQQQECGFNTLVEPVSCDNTTCVEFEEVVGIYGPATGYEPGDLIGTENGVQITFEEHPTQSCDCNVYGLDAGGLTGVTFGSGQVVALQTSGIGLHLIDVPPYESFHIDYYFTEGELTLQVDNGNPVTVNNINDLPTVIAPGVSLSIIPDPNQPGVGTLMFTGLVEHLYLSASLSAAFDNLCLQPLPEDDLQVWPGDTNYDNVASHLDLLNIGLAYAHTGPVRPQTNTEWIAQEATNWPQAFADGINHKHADANGDGTVNAEDRSIILQNYNLTHGPVDNFDELPGTDIDPPAFIDLTGLEELPNGATFQLPVVIGSADQEVEDIYGIAFTLELDPEVIDLSSITITYPTSWLGEPEVNLIHLHKLHDSGRLEVALTRIDHNNVSGHGTVMYIGGIIDDIAGLHAAQYQMTGLYAIEHNEMRKAFRRPVTEMTITETKQPIDRDMLRNTLEIYPNPTSDHIYWRNIYQLPPDRIELYNSAAELLGVYEKPANGLSLAHLPSGVYFLRIHLWGEIITKRVVRMSP
ncbi:MAG: T9SS type A sorting domain-containing protein, partial [Lewinella sp.]|nr:T9SS type A sorting domain-containing protein [Lewinella sp.]